jgi:hypothetical protein
MIPVPKELFGKASDFFVKILSVWKENHFVHFWGLPGRSWCMGLRTCSPFVKLKVAAFANVHGTGLYPLYRANRDRSNFHFFAENTELKNRFISDLVWEAER